MINSKIVIVVPSVLWSVVVVRHTLRDFLIFNCLNDELVSDIEIATDEAVANVIKHSYAEDPSKTISITMEIKDGYVEITVRDFGIKMEVKKIEEPELPDLRESGRGLLLIHKLVDEMEYRNVCKGNMLLLRRKIS